MKNNKGQALVEFILIVPVLIIIILSIVDFGNIISHKYSLENDLDVIVDFYNNNEKDKIDQYLENHNEVIEYSEDNDFTTIVMYQNIKIVTPMLNNILGRNYKIKVSRNIPKGGNNETK